jgi:Family of unknown function (DUF5329)
VGTARAVDRACGLGSRLTPPLPPLQRIYLIEPSSSATFAPRFLDKEPKPSTPAGKEEAMKTRILCLLTIIFGLGASLLPGTALAAEDTNKTVTYLIDYVAGSDLTFVRNGQDSTPKQAAEHMRQKWTYFRNQIKTPEDFILLAATKSELSGKLYLVRLKDGKESPAGEWLTKVLAEYRKKSSS